MAAKSTTHGTPVKSWRITRAGLNGISTGAPGVGLQFAIRRTSSSVTWNPSQCRSAASSSTRIAYGSAARSQPTLSARCGRLWRWKLEPSAVKEVRVPNASAERVFIAASFRCGGTQGLRWRRGDTQGPWNDLILLRYRRHARLCVDTPRAGVAPSRNHAPAPSERLVPRAAAATEAPAAQSDESPAADRCGDRRGGRYLV